MFAWAFEKNLRIGRVFFAGLVLLASASSQCFAEDGVIPEIKWDTNFTATGFANRKLVGQRFTFRLPSIPKDRMARLVFGTDDYAFSSKVGWAALHSGKLSRQGGVVTVQINPGVKKLNGSLRHGIETKSKNGSDRSIRFVERQEQTE